MQSFAFVSRHKLQGRLGDQYQVTLCIIPYVWGTFLFPCYPTTLPIVVISKGCRMGFLLFSIVVVCFVKLSSDDWLCENEVNKSDGKLCEIVK